MKLPKPVNNFRKESVNNYYEKYSLKEKLIFPNIESDKVFKILKNFGEAKYSGIDEISGIFLKDGAKLLITPITELRNLSISSVTFPDACKIAKLKSLFKKGTRTDPNSPSNLDSATYIQSLERVNMNKLWNFLTNTKFCINFNQGLGKTIQPIFACLI